MYVRYPTITTEKNYDQWSRFRPGWDARSCLQNDSIIGAVHSVNIYQMDEKFKQSRLMPKHDGALCASARVAFLNMHNMGVSILQAGDGTQAR